MRVGLLDVLLVTCGPDTTEALVPQGSRTRVVVEAKVVSERGQVLRSREVRGFEFWGPTRGRPREDGSGTGPLQTIRGGVGVQV